MADITMCSGEGCSNRGRCYRYTAKKSLYQSFFSEVPLKGDKCEEFWANDSLAAKADAADPDSF